MKRCLGILVLVFIAASAQAQLLNMVTEIERIDPPSDAPRTLKELVARTPKVRASVISFDFHDSAFLIPVAGNAAGNFGTYFRSDFAIANFRDVAQRIGVAWLQQGINNGNSAVQFFTIPANSTAALADFVGVTLGKTGLGAVVISGVDVLGNPDPNATLDGFSRIWTPQAGATNGATVSQNFDAISVTDSLGSLTGYIIGLRQNTQFRSNVGIVNLDSSPHNWTVRSTVTGAQSTVAVQAYSLSQVSAPAGSGDANGNVTLTLNSDGFGFWWSAYGTSNDNNSGDGWVARAKQ